MKFLEIIQLITAFFLFVSIGNIDSSAFYSFLRILVFITSVLTIFDSVGDMENSFVSKFVVVCSFFIGIIFNPILPIYFYDKESWFIYDIVAGGFFAIKALSTKLYFED